jgi:acetyl esterase/lipase
MRVVVVVLGLPVLAGNAYADAFRPAVGLTQSPLWPEQMDIERPNVTGPENVRSGGGVENVTRPTMTIYAPQRAKTGAAVMVYPGGGYNVVVIGFEGTEICDWLTTRGITCVLLKYRVPGSGPYWNKQCNCRRIPSVPMALQDAQRAIGLLRQRAGSLGVDPHKIGVIGFSAGGHLVAATSNAAERAHARVDPADDLSPRPDFAMALYPGHLWAAQDDEPNNENARDLTLAADIHVSAQTPPTSIVQAQDDPVDDVRHSLSYYMALREAHVPTELHLYAHGGHAFGIRHTNQPITEWTELAERWMRTIGVLAP